jgi:hypothetical protein
MSFGGEKKIYTNNGQIKGGESKRKMTKEKYYI